MRGDSGRSAFKSNKAMIVGLSSWGNSAQQSQHRGGRILFRLAVLMVAPAALGGDAERWCLRVTPNAPDPMTEADASCANAPGRVRLQQAARHRYVATRRARVRHDACVGRNGDQYLEPALSTLRCRPQGTRPRSDRTTSSIQISAVEVRPKRIRSSASIDVSDTWNSTEMPVRVLRDRQC